MATTEPQKWAATLGSTADVNAIPATTPSGSGRASFSGLFPPVTQLPLDQGGIAPERGDFNALFKYLGEYLFYLMQGGMFSYSTDYDYTAGNFVLHGGSLYLCIAANGPGSAIKYPTDTAYWRQLALTSQLPTVNNGTLTIQRNGSTVATFSANQATNETINIDALPIGSYIQFAGSQAPAGFLVCNGGAISRTTYSKLFAVIGTTYGSGDGSTTFNLPNLTDRFLQGNTTVGAVRNAGLPNITGYFNPFAENPHGAVWTEAGGSFYWVGSSQPGWGTKSGMDYDNPLIYFAASKSSPIYGNSATVQPPALTCLICIKY